MAKILACFDHYLAHEGNPITRANAEQRMLQKLERSLTEDIVPLLPPGVGIALGTDFRQCRDGNYEPAFLGGFQNNSECVWLARRGL